MKVRRLLLSVLIIALLGTVTVFASEGLEWYRGEKVAVTINGKPLKSDGLLLQMNKESRTMLPLRDIAETLQAMVEWDGAQKAVSIYKPNVHVTPIGSLKEGGEGVFGIVPSNSKTSFRVFLQIDNLTTSIEELKIEIVDPFGDAVFTTKSDKSELEEAKKTSKAGGAPDSMIWLRHSVNGFHFKYAGEYKIKVYMKMHADSEYYLVAEKVLYSAEN